MTRPLLPRTLKAIEMLQQGLAYKLIQRQLEMSPSHLTHVARRARRNGVLSARPPNYGVPVAVQVASPPAAVGAPVAAKILIERPSALPVIRLSRQPMFALYKLARQQGARIRLDESGGVSFDIRVELDGMREEWKKLLR